MDWNYCQTINFQSECLLRYTWPDFKQNQKVLVMEKTRYSVDIKKVQKERVKDGNEKSFILSNAPIIRKHRVLPTRTNDKKLLEWLVKKDKA